MLKIIEIFWFYNLFTNLKRYTIFGAIFTDFLIFLFGFIYTFGVDIMVDNFEEFLKSFDRKYTFIEGQKLKGIISKIRKSKSRIENRESKFLSLSCLLHLILIDFTQLFYRWTNYQKFQFFPHFCLFSFCNIVIWVAANFSSQLAEVIRGLQLYFYRFLDKISWYVNNDGMCN